MKSDHGTFELDVPRDRNGSFEPEIVKKNQTSMTSEIEDKILSLFALGVNGGVKIGSIESC